MSFMRGQDLRSTAGRRHSVTDFNSFNTAVGLQILLISSTNIYLCGLSIVF